MKDLKDCAYPPSAYMLQLLKIEIFFLERYRQVLSESQAISVQTPAPVSSHKQRTIHI